MSGTATPTARQDAPGTAAQEPLLRAERVSRAYGGRQVLRDVTLELQRNHVLAVLGPNGAGKSTLFRILLLIEEADSGRVLLDGREVGPRDSDARRRIAGVFQRPWLFRGTVRANVAYGLRARSMSRNAVRDAVAPVLEALGLAQFADRSIDSLSGGEAQRVALARALVLRPDVLLLDEPTANLDVTAQRRFREDLEHLVRAHARAAIVVTHDAAEAFALADHVAVLEAGSITQSATPAELVAAPATSFIAAFTGAELLLDGVVDASDADGLVRVRLAGGATLSGRIAVGYGQPATGARVHVAYRPEDITLGPADEDAPTSAVNRLPVIVHSIVPTGGLVRVRLQSGAPLTAVLTRGSADALGVAPGICLTAYLKATALRVFPT